MNRVHELNATQDNSQELFFQYYETLIDQKLKFDRIDENLWGVLLRWNWSFVDSALLFPAKAFGLIVVVAMRPTVHTMR